MKKTLPIYLLVLCLVGSGLGCELINAATDPGPLRVESVDVAPAEGNGVFTASVALTAHTSDDTLQCYIPNAPAGFPDPLYRQTIPALDSSRILTFQFTLTAPGSYTLYCTAMTLMRSGKTTFTVTAPPADANPSAPTLTLPGSVLPVQIKGSGTRTEYYYSSDGTFSCQVAVQVLLTVKADGSAELQTVGPHFSDTINCTAPMDSVAYICQGTANAAGDTATFASCNSGGFDAQGSVLYSNGKLSGTVDCLAKQGSDAGKVTAKIVIP